MKDILGYEESFKLHAAGIVVESDLWYSRDGQLWYKTGITPHGEGTTYYYCLNLKTLTDELFDMKTLIPAPTFLGMWRVLPDKLEGEMPDMILKGFIYGKRYNLNLFKFEDYQVLSYYAPRCNEIYKKIRILCPYNESEYQALCFGQRSETDVIITRNPTHAAYQMLMRLKEEGVV